MAHAATSTPTNAVERELRIEASPAIVFSYLTDPAKIVMWMGREVRADARPGGALEIDYNLMDRMRGEYLEVVPNSRVVFSWGWATLGDQTAPGSSKVEVTLTPDGTGTLLRLVHSGLEGADAQNHGQGWDMFLGYLGEAAHTGSPAQPEPVPLTPSEAFARRLNASLCDLRYLVEGASEQDWGKLCSGSGWSVGVTAKHVVTHGFIGKMAAMIAAGEKPDVAEVTYEVLAEINAESAKAASGVTRAEVLEALLREGPMVVELVKSLDPATLSNTQVMAFAGGVPVTAAAMLEGPLLGDIDAHLADIRAALAG